MNVSLIAATPFPEQLCGAAAAVCTNSDDHERSLKHALASGHTSVLEHAVFTFIVDGLSRAALAQLTRHRVASFDVQSQRYVRLDNPELVIPESIKASPFAAEVESTMRYVMNLYQRMVGADIPAEDARYREDALRLLAAGPAGVDCPDLLEDHEQDRRAVWADAFFQKQDHCRC